MGAHDYEDLKHHVGHNIVCVAYGSGENEHSPANVAVECETCNEVLMDFDKYIYTMNFITDLQRGAIENMAKARNYRVTENLNTMSYTQAAALIRKLNRVGIGQDSEDIT
jgi:hypothetical protein